MDCMNFPASARFQRRRSHVLWPVAQSRAGMELGWNWYGAGGTGMEARGWGWYGAEAGTGMEARG